MKKVIGYFTFVLFLTACLGEDFIDDKLAMKERLSIVAANSRFLKIGGRTCYRQVKTVFLKALITTQYRKLTR